ncbi:MULTISPECIES: carbon-nitrogen hydrolase family protein [Actinokineospora]|uniref:Hydrolase n=1 Tax=Actinokineospora fastidiosa TaxID=1816 RepID=A0A918GTF0_9PSEU|nr:MULTISPECIES: carbon-nitrogen hydrolase family protein [Actinokineospora]UVS79181.1 (R)-stereoselective amidase [Actinokineospora sp. UTMC 2448]GGS58509.1 putative hydrolase [Actinokineospora fastidiosa]
MTEPPQDPEAVRIAGLQTPSAPADVRANLAALERAAEQAAAAGARLLITPELFVTGYDIGDAVHALAREDLVGPAAGIAARTGVGIVLGAPEHADGAYYNSAYFIDDHGRVTARYRKAHLFGDLDRRYFTPGDDLVCTTKFHGITVALLICYDVEFPEPVRAAALAGAHLVAVPTAQMTPFEFTADHLVRTRAWENQVYLAYINHDGSEGSLDYIGRSSVVAPSGDVLDRVEHGTGLLVADVSPEAVRRAQRDNPYLTDRRPGLYLPPPSREDDQP